METDTFFCQLFKQLPQTLFELLGQPGRQARDYRFDSVELKKSLRIDGLYLPRKRGLPLYFVEVQFRRQRRFYANLFAKVFCYLEENDPAQQWLAVAIFPTRSAEPVEQGPYEALLQSPHVRRVYLDDLLEWEDPPVGVALAQLVTVPVEKTKALVHRLIEKSRTELAGRPEGEW